MSVMRILRRCLPTKSRRPWWKQVLYGLLMVPVVIVNALLLLLLVTVVGGVIWNTGLYLIDSGGGVLGGLWLATKYIVGVIVLMSGLFGGMEFWCWLMDKVEKETE